MPGPERAGRGRPWLWLLVSLGGVALDQLTKWICYFSLKGQDSVVLIPGLLRLSYLENPGAAFGSLADQRWLFMILSTVAIIGATVYLLRYAERDLWLRLGLGLVIGGGVGNMIDRVALGYVIDFIDFYGIWPYVFNVADSCACVGVGMLILYCILSMKKELQAAKAAEAAKGQDPTDGEGTHE